MKYFDDVLDDRAEEAEIAREEAEERRSRRAGREISSASPPLRREDIPLDLLARIEHPRIQPVPRRGKTGIRLLDDHGGSL